MTEMTDRSAPLIYLRALPDGSAGEAMRLELADRILSFKYEDEEGLADKLTLTLRNNDLALYDDPAFRTGMTLESQWGYGGDAVNMTPVRQCVVTKISGGTELEVTALAKSLLINRQPKARVFRNVRRSDVVRELAAAAGWGPGVQDIEDTTVVVRSISQARLTDAQLIRRLADEEGFQFYADHAGFHFHRRRVDQAPLRVLRYFTDARGEILDFHLEDDITAKPGRTRVKGRDPLERKDHDTTADNKSDTERGVLANIMELFNPEDGASRLEQEIGTEEVLPTSVSQPEAARRQAQGRFRRTQQAAIKLKLDVVGDPGLLAKSVVDVQGLGRRISGRYYLKSVTSEIGSSGYTQFLELVSDGHGGHSTTSVVAKGLELYETGPKPKGKANKEPPKPGATSAVPAEGWDLEQLEKVDEETGKSVITYRSTR